MKQTDDTCVLLWMRQMSNSKQSKNYYYWNDCCRICCHLKKHVLSDYFEICLTILMHSIIMQKYDFITLSAKYD